MGMEPTTACVTGITRARSNIVLVLGIYSTVLLLSMNDDYEFRRLHERVCVFFEALQRRGAWLFMFM